MHRGAVDNLLLLGPVVSCSWLLGGLVGSYGASMVGLGVGLEGTMVANEAVEAGWMDGGCGGASSRLVRSVGGGVC